MCSHSGHGAMLFCSPFTPFLWKVFCIKPMVAANLLLSNLIFFYIVQIFTESHRLEGSTGNYIVQPPAQPGPVRAGCSGPVPVLASLGSMFQCLTTLIVKNFLPVLSWNFTCSCLCPWPLVLPVCIFEKSLTVCSTSLIRQL